jgi:hypothetical protein
MPCLQQVETLERPLTVLRSIGSAVSQNAHWAVNRPTIQCDLPHPGQGLAWSLR